MKKKIVSLDLYIIVQLIKILLSNKRFRIQSHLICTKIIHRCFKLMGWNNQYGVPRDLGSI